ncbi:VWA domain-containing protein [Methanococcus aeolicus]|nr:VWA domain-containing protein [Methanococcus aeolicus]
MFNANGNINPNIIKIKKKDNINRYSSGRQVKSISKKGRYIKYKIPRGKTSDIAFDATFRASALYQKDRKEKSDNKNILIHIKKEDLREKVREKKISTNILFAVDASGSMGAMKRMEVSKGAISSLLMDAYQKRNKIGMISFRKEDAELILPFTSSVELGEKLLRNLPTGGKTPLSKAFFKSYEAIKNEIRKNPNIIPVALFISDFKPNVAMKDDYIKEVFDICEKFAEDEITVILVDTEPKSFIKIGIGENLAKKYGFEYYKIDDLNVGDIVGIVNNLAIGGNIDR